ncbi:hypothetical protein J4458_05705 [Candidatus Woesearchaeota archaeon]|nr:hypothetical protein [Candidatus Woesearchaeota archaeon]
MRKMNGMHWKYKKEKSIKNKKPILYAFFSSIFKFNLAIAILIILLAIIVAAGDVIVQNGRIDIDSKLVVDAVGNVGIGTINPRSKLSVAGDVEITNTINGIVLKSDNGICWRIKVTNTGDLFTNGIGCP